jgi:hypothetical protein
MVQRATTAGLLFAELLHLVHCWNINKLVRNGWKCENAIHPAFSFSSAQCTILLPLDVAAGPWGRRDQLGVNCVEELICNNEHRFY